MIDVALAFNLIKFFPYLLIHLYICVESLFYRINITSKAFIINILFLIKSHKY